MPDATCGRCRKTIRSEDRRKRCPFCKAKLTRPAAESHVTIGRHASIRTAPPPIWLAAPEFDEPPPAYFRRKRGTGDLKLAAAALLLVGLVGTFLGVLPRFWRPVVGPTPPLTLTAPVHVTPAPPALVKTPAEPTPPLPPPIPEAHHEHPPEPADMGDPRTARFRAKLKSLEWLYGPPKELTYSADLRRAAFLSRNRIVRVWDVEAPNELLLLLGRDAVHVAFSADDSRLLTVDGQGIFGVWDLTAGVELRRMDAGLANIVFLCFSPDGRRGLVGCEAPNRRTLLHMWDLKTGRETTAPADWRAAWATRAAATVPGPALPPFVEFADEAATTALTLHVPSRPVEAENADPADAPVYLLSTTIGKKTITEIVEVDGGR